MKAVTEFADFDQFAGQWCGLIHGKRAFFDHNFCSCVLAHNFVCYRPDGGVVLSLGVIYDRLSIINKNIGKTLQESVI